MNAEAEDAVQETTRLAFAAALQHLPSQQRSVLILCDALKISAAEVAELMDTSVASVNSALQRARAMLADRPPDRLDDPMGEQNRVLLARYVDAFERYDIDKLVMLLRHDAVLSVHPLDAWIQGRVDLHDFYLGQEAECRGSKLLPLALEGCAGFAHYRCTEPGEWTPWSIQVIEVVDGWIVADHNLLYPDLFAAFGLPDCLSAGHGLPAADVSAAESDRR